jgi:antitoxin component YwqK of YwqJK toxin-antitoxin module
MKTGNKIEGIKFLAPNGTFEAQVTKEYYPSGKIKAKYTEIQYSDVSITTYERNYYEEDGNCSYERTQEVDFDEENRRIYTKNYYPDGSLRSYISNNYTAKISTFKEYYPDGTLEFIGEFIIDSDQWFRTTTRIGEHKHFHENGQLELVERFRKNGRRIGNVEGFYENGEPAFIENYKTDRDEESASQHGEWISYSRQGDIDQRMKYKNGEYIDKNILWSYLCISDLRNYITYNDKQLENDIVFKHFKREIFRALSENSIWGTDIFEWTDCVPDRIRNDEDIANEVIECIDISWLPVVFDYIGDELKANEKFMDHYCECFRYMLRNDLPRKRKVLWTEPDCYSKNEMILFLSIILELNEMDERIIDLPFNNWLSEELGKYVSYEFFQSLNHYQHVFEAAYLEQY